MLFIAWVFKILSNSSSNLACSGPAIIHLRKADGFSVSPTAPPEPFTFLFILLMSLVNRDVGELFLSLLNNPGALELFLDAMWKTFHVPNMYRDPSCIVCMVKSKEPWHQCFQCLNIQVKVLSTVSANEDEDKDFIAKNVIPELKSGALFYHILSPCLKRSTTIRRSLLLPCIIL